MFHHTIRLVRTATAAAALVSAVMVQAAGWSQFIASTGLTQAQGMTLNEIYAINTSRDERQHGG
jgi:hypothetical protein